jgi:hypothetical protein
MAKIKAFEDSQNSSDITMDKPNYDYELLNQEIVKNKNNLLGFFTIFSGICLSVLNGSSYLWGNISGYVVSYYHFKGDTHATLAFAVICIPMNFVITGICYPFSAMLQKAYNPKIVIFCASLITVGGFYVASLMDTWYGFLLFYAFVQPIGMGLSYMIPMTCAWEWFPNNQGLVTGILCAGFGFSAFFFGLYSTYIVNPEDIDPVVPQDGSGTTDKLYPEAIANNVP